MPLLLTHVVRIGDVEAPPLPAGVPVADLMARAEKSLVRCVDDAASAKMVKAIEAAQKAGDSLGGVVEVILFGVPAGLGSHSEWDLRLDGRIAQALMSIQAMKAVEVGLGLASASRPGSAVHDPIEWSAREFL